MNIRYLSIFSGIEAATVAWEPLGWECVGVCEIDPFPCKVLAHHYPSVPNLGDVTKITEDQIKSLGNIDVVIFGSPCQDLSIAGKQKGFTHEDGSTTRSGLFNDAMRIVRWSCTRFALWENVPGAFSSNKGADFATVVGEMAGITDVETPKNGWGSEGAAIGDNGLLEWCVLDAQWFGLAQRRKRVFAILDTGNWMDRPPILLEPESLRGNIAPSREAGKNTTSSIRESVNSGICGTLNASCAGTSRTAGQGNELDFCIVDEVAATTTGGTCSGKHVFGTLMANCGTKQWLGNQEALSGDYHVFALAGNTIGRQPENGGNGNGYDESGVSYTMTKTDQHAVAVSSNMQVRRLTPTECERLQGFPEITKNVIINVCSDHQKTNALAGTQCHKSPNAANNAEASELQKTASFADANLQQKNHKTSKRVEVSVHLNLEAQTLEIHSHEKLLLSASIAEQKKWFHPHIQPEDFVRLNVRLHTLLGKKTHVGEEELQASIKNSLAQKNGSRYVNLSGQEIELLANDAEKFINTKNFLMKSITSEVGPNFQTYEQIIQTLCCCVLSAISSFIPEEILKKSSYEINLSLSHGYTNIPGASDAGRYKALGNSMATPVIKWIGRKIEEAMTYDPTII